MFRCNYQDRAKGTATDIVAVSGWLERKLQGGNFIDMAIFMYLRLHRISETTPVKGEGDY